MDEIKLYADDLILFSFIAESGSFTKAAETTGHPKSSLSRRLSKLETALGQRLLHRSTRQLALTEFGETMLAYARRLAEEQREANTYATSQRSMPQGILRVSLPPEFHELSFGNIISNYLQKYPNVSVNIDLSARRVDLVNERFDVAVRAAASLPDDSTLVARKITQLNNRLYASPHYLSMHGYPDTPEALLDHKALALVGPEGKIQKWQLSNGHNHWEGLSDNVSSMNSMGLLRSLAEQHLGIAGLSDTFATPLVHQGKLKAVLPDWSLPPTILWCVTPGRHLLPPRTTAFIEALLDSSELREPTRNTA